VAELDLDEVRRLNEARRGTDDARWNDRELARNELQSLLMRETDVLIAALSRAERVEAAAREMLRFGEHEGLCTNHDDASGTESCVFHVEAFNGRRDELVAALAAASAEEPDRG